MKDKEIEEMAKGLSIREESVAGEISKVVVKVYTGDGESVTRTISKSDIQRTLSAYQTIGNCVGFPAARLADFAVVKSALGNPTRLLRDYLDGKLDDFFDSRYRAAFWEVKNDKNYLRIPGGYFNKDKFYYVGKKKPRYELDLSICDYLHEKKRNEKCHSKNYVLRPAIAKIMCSGPSK